MGFGVYGVGLSPSLRKDNPIPALAREGPTSDPPILPARSGAQRLASGRPGLRGFCVEAKGGGLVSLVGL